MAGYTGGYPTPNYPNVPNYPNYGGYNPFNNPAPNQQQQNTNDGAITWVRGEAGAKAFLVAPNHTAQLWDSEAQVIYLKSADASGMPSMKILDYTIREQNNSNQLNDKSDYVTKSDLEEFGNRLMKQMGRDRQYNKGNKENN